VKATLERFVALDEVYRPAALTQCSRIDMHSSSRNVKILVRMRYSFSDVARFTSVVLIFAIFMKEWLGFIGFLHSNCSAQFTYLGFLSLFFV
jgi:hypothetical protein